MVRVLTSSKYKDFYIDEDQKGEVVYTPNYNDLAYIMKSINSKYKFAIDTIKIDIYLHKKYC